MKKFTLWIAGILGSLSVIAVIAAIVLHNPVALFVYKTRLTGTILQSDIRIIETQGVYGKLNGNGNDIQFFVAVLVEAEEAEIAALVAQIEDQYDIVGYQPQTTTQLDVPYLEHQQLRYETNMMQENYYTLYLFSTKGSNPLDLLGH